MARPRRPSPRCTPNSSSSSSEDVVSRGEEGGGEGAWHSQAHPAAPGLARPRTRASIGRSLKPSSIYHCQKNSCNSPCMTTNSCVIAHVCIVYYSKSGGGICSVSYIEYTERHAQGPVIRYSNLVRHKYEIGLLSPARQGDFQNASTRAQTRLSILSPPYHASGARPDTA